MYSSNLIKLLSKLDTSEWKSFDKFVHSPYFNSNKSIQQLFELLKKYYPDFDSPKLEKEKVFKKLFPGQAYREKRMWQLMSDLKGLTEQFLVAEKTNKQSTSYQLQLREVFLERDLFSWFEQKSVKLGESLEQMETLDIYNQYYLHSIHHNIYFNNESNKEIINHPHLKASFDHLDNFYHLQKLKYACEWVARAFRFKEEIPIDVNEVIPYSEQKHSLLYKLYYFVFLLYQYPISEDAALFDKIKVLLKKNLDKLTKEDSIALLLYLINFGIKKYQLNFKHYKEKLLGLYNYGLDQDLLLYKGKLPEAIFMNILALNLALNKYKEAETFVSTYSVFLNKEVMEVQEKWAKLKIEFGKKNYKEVISVADSFYFKHPKQELTRRSIQIRACFEHFIIDKSYFQLLITKSSNFEKYLKRKDLVASSKRNIYFNLNRGIRNLAELIYERQHNTKFERLLKNVNAEKELGAKDWLINHIKCNQPIPN